MTINERNLFHKIGRPDLATYLSIDDFKTKEIVELRKLDIDFLATKRNWLDSEERDFLTTIINYWCAMHNKEQLCI